MKLRKYSSRIVRKEAKMYLDGYSMNQISAKLNIPNQTISWHLIHPLADIDYDAWIKIRKKLLGRAKTLQDKLLKNGPSILMMKIKEEN